MNINNIIQSYDKIITNYDKELSKINFRDDPPVAYQRNSRKLKTKI